MYLSDAQVLGSMFASLFVCSIIGAIVGLIKNPIYMPKGITSYGTNSNVYKGAGQAHAKVYSPEYMLKKGKFHKVKSKMHKRRKEHQLDFAEIERNNFVGYEYLNKPYLFPCRKP